MYEIHNLHLSKTSLLQIHSCKLYLDISHLSDMLDPNGKKIEQNYITGTKSTKQKSIFKWPHQMKPSTTAWKLWEKTIKSIFKLTSNYILPIELQLSNWIVPLHERQIQHRWYFSLESNEIYNRNQHSIQRYFIQSINNNRYEINEDSKVKCESIPNDAIPIIYISKRIFQVYEKFTPNNLTQREPNDFNNYIKFLPTWKQALIKNYKEPANAESLISLIQQKNIRIIASDGSKSCKTSGGGWVIVNAEGNEIITGFNPDFGDITQINSHRAEIYGALSVFLFLQEYCNFYRITLQSPI